MKRSEQGVTMLVVLVLLSVMLLGGLALARMTEIGTLASGNAGYREASVQASDVGLNTAFAAVRALADEHTATAGSWYWNTPQADLNGDGIPDVDFDAAPSLTVGPYDVRYVVERMCFNLPLVDPLRQCLVRQELPEGPSSVDPTKEKIDPVNSRQFRVTVRVKQTNDKGVETWVQSLLTKG